VLVGAAVVVVDVGDFEAVAEEAEGGGMVEALDVGVAGVPADSGAGCVEGVDELGELLGDGAELLAGAVVRGGAVVAVFERDADGAGRIGVEHAVDEGDIALEEHGVVGNVEGAGSGAGVEDDPGGADDGGGAHGALTQGDEGFGLGGGAEWVEDGGVHLAEGDAGAVGDLADAVGPGFFLGPGLLEELAPDVVAVVEVEGAKAGVGAAADGLFYRARGEDVEGGGDGEGHAGRLARGGVLLEECGDGVELLGSSFDAEAEGAVRGLEKPAEVGATLALGVDDEGEGVGD
jgi:hypothetical protein